MLCSKMFKVGRYQTGKGRVFFYLRSYEHPSPFAVEGESDIHLHKIREPLKLCQYRFPLCIAES